MTTGNENEINTFFLAFIGQEVIITVKSNTTVNFTDEQGHTLETMPVFYEGVLLDKDEDYYYLGAGPNEITQAVKKTEVMHIMVKPNKDIYEEVLDSMPDPESDEDVN